MCGYAWTHRPRGGPGTSMGQCPAWPDVQAGAQLAYVATHARTDAVVVQAQALDSACLAMLAEVMGRTAQLDTMEYLMAGMWILLRTPANRALLSTAFDPKKVAGTRYDPKRQYPLASATQHPETQTLPKQQALHMQ